VCLFFFAISFALTMSTYLSFLDYLSRMEPRNYKILLDCGPSMRGTPLNQAEKALVTLLPPVCSADPEGMSLTMFADSYISAGKLQKDEDALHALTDMAEVFRNSPCSRLAEAIKCAVEEHQKADLRTTSILVITAGTIADMDAVKHVISDAVHKMLSYFELGISILQVGSDPAGTAALKGLAADVKVQCRWPVVDFLALEALPGGPTALEGFLHTSSAPFHWAAETPAVPTGRRVSVWGTTPLPEPAAPRRLSRTSPTPSPRTLPPVQQVNLAFYNSLVRREQREYSVLLDCSSGMGLADYNVARHILSRTLASVYDLNPAGITVWVMQGAKTIGTEYIVNGKMLDDVFWEHVPEGATRLSSGLRHMFTDYFSRPDKKGRKTSILIVVASPPVDWFLVTDILVKAAMDDKYLRLLTVSILNVGTGPDFTAQLAEEVNTRAARNFVDSYQVPTGAPNTQFALARQVSEVLRENDDLVHHYVGSYFPDSMFGQAFDIQPSKQFYTFARERQGAR